MKQKSSAFVLVAVLVGFVATSIVANRLYDWKADLAPYEAKAPTQFYAGLDKFLSNVSWMTLVQWRSDDAQQSQRDAPARADALYRKLNALTNLDPLFADAYLDGALSLAPQKPAHALALLDKAIAMGLDRNWKVPFYAGLIHFSFSNDPRAAQPYFEMAARRPDAPEFVQSSLLNARCRQLNDEPVGSLRVWYEHYVTLAPGDAIRRTMAASQISGYAEQAVADAEAKLPATTDPTAREALLKTRDWAAGVMKEVQDAVRQNDPTTMPAVPGTSA